jgi:DNA-binding protein HU-beta
MDQTGINDGLACSDFAELEPVSAWFSFKINLQQPTSYKGDNVNKSELIDAVAESADISKAEAGRVIDAMIDTITGSLKKDDPVVLVGFGTFATKNRAARTGRNPQTGAPIQIAAARVPSFKAGKALKDAVNS